MYSNIEGSTDKVLGFIREEFEGVNYPTIQKRLNLSGSELTESLQYLIKMRQIVFTDFGRYKAI